MLVLEHIPDALAEAVTRAVDIPTIGIGAGKSCDGQVLVINDAIGLGDRWPPFSRQYAYVSATIVHAAAIPQVSRFVDSRECPVYHR